MRRSHRKRAASRGYPPDAVQQPLTPRRAQYPADDPALWAPLPLQEAPWQDMPGDDPWAQQAPPVEPWAYQGQPQGDDLPPPWPEEAWQQPAPADAWQGPQMAQPAYGADQAPEQPADPAPVPQRGLPQARRKADNRHLPSLLILGLCVLALVGMGVFLV